MIAPFILMPFVENAFKHVSKGRDHKNFIAITVDMNHSTLRLHVINSAEDETSRDLSQTGGIGLENVTRRLSLLYPDLHRLNIRSDSGKYEVVLELQLSEQAIAPTSVQSLIPSLQSS